MKTLLIVEDEKMIRQGIRAMIQRSGVPIENILECSNGEQALEILNEQEVDVMFTDIRMPKMSGIELVKAMQDLPNRPMTVAVSGYDDFNYAVEMLRAGIKEYILKPVDREQVKQILEQLEAELVQKKEKSVNSRMIGCGQLKHLIQDEKLTEAEKSAIIQEFGDGFYAQEYIVCCMDNRLGEMASDDEYVYINNLGDSEIYLMKPELLEEFRSEEWEDRFVGVSSRKSGLWNLREAYEEAYKAREKAFWTEKALVEYTTQFAGRADEEPGNIPSLENDVQMMGTDKYEQSIRTIRNMLWNAKRQDSHEELEKIIAAFLDSLLATYEAVLHTESEEVEQLKHLYAYPCAGEYERELTEWLEQFADHLNCEFEDYKNKQKIRQAVLYIRENYDHDLNMAVVSNHISMNYSLFSYAFKQYTGRNFVNFLKDIRMEKAKELLEKTDLRIVEISQKIGYENEKHFMKTFKTSCGVSPTEYRKNMQYRKEQ